MFTCLMVAFLKCFQVPKVCLFTKNKTICGSPYSRCSEPAVNQILRNDKTIVSTNSGYSGNNLSEFELVEDGGFSCSIKTYHQNPHFFPCKKHLHESRNCQTHCCLCFSKKGKLYLHKQTQSMKKKKGKIEFVLYLMINRSL